MDTETPGQGASDTGHVTAPPAPVATYRLQLRPQFGFEAAAAEVPYLAELGISDVYLSPVFAARAGSVHGYDISDHSQLNPELGGHAAYEMLEHAMRAHALRAMLDIVPNHMGIDPRTNRWWRDVLENGPSSPYSAFFDIDWHPIKPELENRVLLPILGDQYGAALERGELRVALADGAFELRYFDHCLPLNPRQLPSVLDADALRASIGDERPEVQEFLSILTALRNRFFCQGLCLVHQSFSVTTVLPPFSSAADRKHGPVDMQLPHPGAGRKSQAQEADYCLVFSLKGQEVLAAAACLISLMLLHHFPAQELAKPRFSTTNAAAMAVTCRQQLLGKLTQIGFLDPCHDELGGNVPLHTLQPNVGGQNLFYARDQLCSSGVAQRDVLATQVLPVKLGSLHH